MPTIIQSKSTESVTITVDGQRIKVRGGISIAAALVENGIDVFRHTPVSGAPRAPFCMMGACFDCLVRVNGVDNQQACQLEVRDGMVIERHLKVSELDSTANDGGCP